MSGRIFGTLICSAGILLTAGCAANRQGLEPVDRGPAEAVSQSRDGSQAAIERVSYRQAAPVPALEAPVPDNGVPDNAAPDNAAPDNAAPGNAAPDDAAPAKQGSGRAAVPLVPAAGLAGGESRLTHLEQQALGRNPGLLLLHRNYLAAASRTRSVDKLPDPRLGVNVFGAPLETAAGSQRANFNLSQAIPWLARLNAEQQRACFETLAASARYESERARLLAKVRVGWYRLYVLDRQIETAKANQELLDTLVEVANARVATGRAGQSDVLLGTLEISQLQERLLSLRQQRATVQAQLNQLVAQPADTPIPSAASLDLRFVPHTGAELYQYALETQPEIKVARLMAQATRWGIEVAELKRRPEFLLSASYFVTDDNRLPSPVVAVGEDPWALGAQVTLPLGREKYDAIYDEAGWQHQAAHDQVRQVQLEYESRIQQILAEATRARETAELYRSTILPQARQTLAADQAGYTNGVVEFDRVIRAYRSLLTLELGYQQAVGDLAVANVQLMELAGRELVTEPLPANRSDAADRAGEEAAAGDDPTQSQPTDRRVDARESSRHTPCAVAALRRASSSAS